MPGFHFSLDFLHRSEYQQNRCVAVKERNKTFRAEKDLQIIAECPLYNGIP